jgi:hypothetical protein
MIISLLVINKGYGQDFEPATMPETDVGATSVDVRCIGNDVFTDGNDVFRVSVWDDLSTNPGLAWEVDYQSNFYSGWITLQNTSDIIDPDVVITTDGTEIYALVAYHDFGAPDYYLDLYMWRNTGSWEFVWISTTNFFPGEELTTFMNIDADTEGRFVIVVDRLTKILIFSGEVAAGAVSFNNSMQNVGVGDGSYPDICLYNDLAGNVLAHVSYVNTNGDLVVSTHDYNSPSAGGLFQIGSVLNSPQAGFDFFFPRIACANAAGGDTDWTVVMEEHDGNVYYIVGFNGSAPNTPIYYNDGSAISGVPLHEVPNTLPVVAYDNHNNVWVGWTFNDLGVSYPYNDQLYAMYPIVLPCDQQAIVTASEYWQVPTFAINSDVIPLLALAGRYGTSEFYLTYYSFIAGSGISEEIYNKQIDPGIVSHLRTSMQQIPPENVKVPLSEQIANCAEGDVWVRAKLYDLTGRIVGSDRIENFTLNIRQLAERAGLKHGNIYLLKLETENFAPVTRLYHHH